MARKSGNGGQPVATSTEAPKMIWDDSNLRSSYANVCNVSSTREEVVMMFGVSQDWEHTEGEVKVQLTDRVILSPFAAKRLALLLENVVGQYEQRFGALDAQPQPRAEAEA